MNPPNSEDSIQILEGLRTKYEQHHKVHYTPDAIRAAVTLAERYISERFLPDKAIDVLDETGARVKLNSIKVPQDLLDMESELAEVLSKKEEAVANQDYENAAKCRAREEELQNSIAERKKQLQEEGQETPIVDESDIRDCISKMTGIPVSRLGGEETQKLLHLGEEIKQRIIGQDAAVDAIVKSIRRTRAGIRSSKRPMGSFLFLGPTGVGKTELAKVLSLTLFGSEDSMIRIDMSEYMEKHSVWASRKVADSSPRRCASARIPWCSSTKSRRRIRTSTTSCSRFLTTASSRIVTAARSTSRTPSSS